MRLPLLFAMAALVAGPAIAETAAPGAGRYAIQPGDDGFVRLDTETGSVSHCRRSNGVWHCDSVAENNTALERRLDALTAKLDTLAGEVAALKAEIAALKVDADRKPMTLLSPEDEKELDRALGFAERLMERFFRMVRDLKGEESSSI